MAWPQRPRDEGAALAPLHVVRRRIMNMMLPASTASTMQELKKINKLQFVLVTAFASVDPARSAINLHAFDYITTSTTC